MKKNHDFDIGCRSYVLKCVIVFSLLFFMQLVSFEGWAQKQEVRLTLKRENVSLQNVFKEITSLTGFDFVYSSNLLDNKKVISVDVRNELLDKVLDLVLKETNLGYKIEDRYIIISPKLQKDDPKKLLTFFGVVKEKGGATLPGVTVVLKGTRIGVTSDERGKFVISVPEMQETVLEFSFVGMKKKEVKVKAQTPLVVVLEEDLAEIEEVVVTGIFNKPKESFTGAAVKITREELKMAGNRNVLKSISNIDPSFMIVENNSQGANPNALPEIRLRGVSSIPSVDQLQTATRGELTTPLFILDGFEITLEQMMDLNNDEIESITILKDASATAIYGSRGSNGVVVITSVKPEKGKLKLSYNVNMNFEIPDLNSYRLLNAKDKLQLEWDAGLYDNVKDDEDLKLKQSYARKLERVLAGVDTDWLSIPVQVGVGHNHYLGLSGGDKAFRYSLGLSLNQIKGAMKGSDRSTLNGNSVISYTQDKFGLSNTMSFGVNNSSNSPYGGFGSYANMNPYWEPYDANGYLVKQFETDRNALFMSAVNNPLWDAKLNSFNKSKYNSITDNVSFFYKPVSGLQLDVRVSFNKTFSESDIYLSPRALKYISYGDPLERGDRSYTSENSQRWSVGVTGNYFKSWKKHVFSAGVNYEIREEFREKLFINVYGFLNEEMYALNSANSYKNRIPITSDAKSRAIGFTATVNYNYDNRYYVDGSYRLDGASSFGSDSRFAPFWSLGCGWTISNEPIVREYISFISNLRVKYSYGVTGSMAFSPWQSQGTYLYSGTGIDKIYQGGVIAIMRGLENKDLKWQNTYQQNLGVDLGIWENRLSVSANYYRKLTDNSITDMALPLSNGFKSYTGNSGEILNVGFDVNASVYILRNREKQLSWNVVFGTSFNKNKLKKLSEAVKERMNEAMGSQKNGLFYVYQEGQSVDAIYAVPTVGVDPSTGRMVYVYKDGSQSYNYDVSQRVVCGDRMPKLDGRLSTSFQWRGLTLNAGFTIRAGGQKYNQTYASKIENVDFTKNVDRRVKSERWIKPGDEAIFSGLKEKNNFITDRYIQDERTFACNNLNVTYNCNQKWLAFIGLSRLSFSASISNVFYFSTVKQERGTDYPYAIQPTFGLSCAF